MPTSNNSPPPITVSINEWMASNTRTLLNTNNNNRFDDWFELYNPSAFAADLTGYWLTDDLTNTLSRSPGLRVISRQSMQGYRGKPVDVAAVGTELEVRYVLEGSIRREGDRLRVNVELIDPATRSPAWSARVERQNGEQSAVRDEIVGRLARELTLEIPTIEVARGPADPGVHDLNYKGWAAIYASGTSAGALRQAEEAFSQALMRVPNSKAAQIGRGHPQPCEPVYIWLLGGDLTRCEILHDRVGPRPAVRYPLVLRDPHGVAQEVRRPERIHRVEEAGDADREREDDADVEIDVVLRREAHEARCR